MSEDNIDPIEDLKLVLTRSKDGEVQEFYVHSHQLSKKSGFFKAMLSKTWSPPPPPPNSLQEEHLQEIKLIVTHPIAYYKQCLEFMYSPHHFSVFDSVSHTLGVLTVACEWLVEDCVDACMNSLEAMRWSHEDEIRIKVVLDYLQVKATHDLSCRFQDRLSISDSQHLQGMQKTLRETLDYVFGELGRSWKVRNRLKDIMVGFFSPQNDPRAYEMSPRVSKVTSVCREVLMEYYDKLLGIVFERFNEGGSWDLLCCVTKLNRELDRELYIYLLKAFIIKESFSSEDISDMPVRDFMCFLVWVLKGLAFGEVVVCREERLGFLEKWVRLFLCTKLHCEGGDRMNEFVDCITMACESLPLQDQKRVYLLWKDGVNDVKEIYFLKSAMCSVNLWWVKQLRYAYVRRSPMVTADGDLGKEESTDGVAERALSIAR